MFRIIIDMVITFLDARCPSGISRSDDCGNPMFDFSENPWANNGNSIFAIAHGVWANNLSELHQYLTNHCFSDWNTWNHNYERDQDANSIDYLLYDMACS